MSDSGSEYEPDDIESESSEYESDDVSEDVEFSLDVVVDEKKNKVIYAKADSKFADILLSFLTLPLGCIVRHCPSLKFGSLTGLYKGLEELKTDHFWTDGGKKMLLEPRNSYCNKLEFNLGNAIASPVEYYTCGDRVCKRKRTSYVTMYCNTMKCRCGRYLDKEMVTENLHKYDDEDDSGFVSKRTSVFITDDLHMMTRSHLKQYLTRYGYGFYSSLVAQRTVILGSEEIRNLLEICLVSKTPLTDFIFKEKSMETYSTGKVCSLHPIVAKASTSDSKKMTVKAFLRKSTNKLLFAQAKDDFIDFLFGFLTIPLGAIEWLLEGEGDPVLGSIDNLYKSLANLKSIIDEDTQKQLLKPDLPPMYLSKNQLFPLSQQMATKMYYYESFKDSKNRTQERGCFMCLKDPKGKETYIKRPGVFMVADDLTVTPLRTSSILSILKEMEVPLSDVEEMKLKVGSEEALGILKASLASTSALTDGLIVPMLNKQQKQHQ